MVHFAVVKEYYYIVSNSHHKNSQPQSILSIHINLGLNSQQLHLLIIDQKDRYRTVLVTDLVVILYRACFVEHLGLVRA